MKVRRLHVDDADFSLGRFRMIDPLPGAPSG